MRFESKYSKFAHTTYVFYTTLTISVNKSLYIPDTFEKKIKTAITI
jgi:hypothetical protein